MKPAGSHIQVCADVNRRHPGEESVLAHELQEQRPTSSDRQAPLMCGNRPCIPADKPVHKKKPLTQQPPQSRPESSEIDKSDGDARLPETPPEQSVECPAKKRM